MRTWSSKRADDGSIHAMGSGGMVVYGRGPDVAFAYAPYSSPNAFWLETKCDGELTDESTREPGTAIWNHTARIDGKPALQFTEFVASDPHSYVRSFRCSEAGVRWVVRAGVGGKFVPAAKMPNAWVQLVPRGQLIFNYPSNTAYFHYVMAKGSCRAELKDTGEIVVECLPGEGSVSIVGATDLPTATINAGKLAKTDATTLLDQTRRRWQQFTAKRLANRPELKKLPARELEVLDSVAVLLESQQSADGGEMAGPVFPLAYIRDQYGVARGMLSLGMFDQARRNLDFRFHKFSRFGSLLTAETMGTDCARHQHENDEVEGPAYTILQARDYINTTKDPKFGRTLWPMLDWCWKVQQSQMTNGLLPFNGDETYVAGGFYPRSGLEQGSADTTLVYIESGKWLAKWAVEQKLWTKDYANEQLKRVEIARAAYRKHFLDKDRIWANEPALEQMREPRRFRHGVCEAQDCNFGWTERSDTGRYVCPTALATKTLPEQHPARMEVNSVSLLPAYIGSDVISPKEMRAVIDHVISQANTSGHIPSVPSTEGCVGYDPGLTLMNLVATNHPDASKAFDRLMRIVDPTDAWNEYYDGTDNVRNGCCRCRPWESGVNAAALIVYGLSVISAQ